MARSHTTLTPSDRPLGDQTALTGTTTPEPTPANTPTNTPAVPDPAVSPERALRRARLAAMAQPRPGDTPHTAALRAMLRDEALMADVTANVDQWPDPTDDQRQAIAALVHHPTTPRQ
jgi:hypothetical protein